MRRINAFTLVELLVALTITIVLFLILTSVVAATLGAWSQGRNRLDTYASARQVLDRITDELKGAGANPAVSGSQIQFVENIAFGGVTTPNAYTSESVFFVAPHPNLGGGDLCTIAYALDSATHELKRSFRSSDQAWADGTGNRYQAAGHTYTAADWHVIARGVLQFELRCYSQHDLDTNTDPPASTWDSESTDIYMIGQAPRRIVVRMQVVDDRTATQLVGIPPGTIYNRIVQRSARQFFSEVALPQP